MNQQNKDALTIRDLTLDYGASRAVYDVNFVLKPLTGVLLVPVVVVSRPFCGR